MNRKDLIVGTTYAWDKNHGWEHRLYGVEALLVDAGPFTRAGYLTAIEVDGTTIRADARRAEKGPLVAVRFRTPQIRPGADCPWGEIRFVPAAQLRMTWEAYGPWRADRERELVAAANRARAAVAERRARNEALIERAVHHGVKLRPFIYGHDFVNLDVKDFARLLDLADAAPAQEG